MMYNFIMKSKYKVLFYKTKTNKCYVEEFLDSLDKLELAKVLSWISLLEEKRALLPRPYADLLEDGIHELRIKVSGQQERVLYFFCYQNIIVLTHNFTKNTDKVPKSEIKKAKTFKSDFLGRFTKEKIMEDYKDD
jgi:phage-related protein